MREVTDPALLQALEGGEVTDPELLQQLEAGDAPPVSSDFSPLGFLSRYLKQGVAERRRQFQQNYGGDFQKYIADRGRTDVLGRAAKGVSDPLVGGAQLAANVLPEAVSGPVNRMVAQSEADYQTARERQGQSGIDLPRMLGNAAMVMAMPGAKGPFKGTTLGQRSVNSAVTGGIGGALQPIFDPENFWSDKAVATATGAGAGLVAAPVMEGAARVISPAASKAAKPLLKEGITPTPGQLLGGMAKTAEEKAVSLPFIGDIVRSGQQSANVSLNRAAINRALAPINEKLPAGLAGRQAIDFAQTKLGAAYDSVLSKIGQVTPDQQLVAEFNQIGQQVQNLPKDKMDQFVRVLRNEVAGRIKNGTLPAEALKAAESNLGQISRGYLKSQDYDQRQLGKAIQEAQQALRQMVQRQAPQFAEELQKINQGWANFMRPQRAATSVGAQEGVFSAAQLHSAVKAMDPSRNKAAFARGQALMQDLSEPAKAMMTPAVANSGTADRALLAYMLANPVKATGLFAASLPASALYSDLGRRAAAAAIARRPEGAEAAADWVRRFAPIGGLLAGPQLYPQLP